MCFQEVRFLLCHSLVASMLQRNIEKFVIRKDMFCINIGPFTIITNKEIVMKLLFLLDLKKHITNCKVKLNFGVIYK